ncbi:MAG: hypothetical protein H6707_12445 [Deltaproteobacteria bacterium]|nr:hypothetical protein [Deltaproteobacteria bacterium]
MFKLRITASLCCAYLSLANCGPQAPEAAEATANCTKCESHGAVADPRLLRLTADTIEVELPRGVIDAKAALQVAGVELSLNAPTWQFERETTRATWAAAGFLEWMAIYVGGAQTTELDLVVRLSCNETLAANRSDLCGSAVSLAVATFVRPLSGMKLPLVGGVKTGTADKTAIASTARRISECEHVLLTVGGTQLEGRPVPWGLRGFLARSNYDCIVGLQYDDGDATRIAKSTPQRVADLGAVVSEDALRYCASTKLGIAALEALVSNTPLAESTIRWDAFGHSKGAAILAGAYLAHEPTLKTTFYGVGLPRHLGQRLFEDYRVGSIQVHGSEVYAWPSTQRSSEERFISFTWADDPAGNLDGCGDVGAALSVVKNWERHQYDPLFANESWAAAYLRGDVLTVGNYPL